MVFVTGIQSACRFLLQSFTFIFEWRKILNGQKLTKLELYATG